MYQHGASRPGLPEKWELHDKSSDKLSRNTMDQDKTMFLVASLPLREAVDKVLPEDVKVFLIHEDDGKRDEAMLWIMEAI
jgi:hypothetical protein